MKWIEVSVSTSAGAAEAVANKLMEYQADLGDYPAGGVSIDDPKALTQRAATVKWDEVVDVPTGTQTDTDVVVRAYYPQEVVKGEFVPELRAWVQRLSEFGLDAGKGEVQVRSMHEEDWAHAWKAYYHPERVGEHLVIVPSWEEYASTEGDVEIALDPGMAFGTGTHPTTVLCLEALEEHISSNDVVFDVGTGSGILAIAAAKLGAADVKAVDIDPVAVKAAVDNVRCNRVEAVVAVSQGTVESVNGQADLVLANIIATIIIDISPQLYAKTKPGGMLLASGIICDKADLVRKALTDAGFTIAQRRTKGDWVLLAALRQKG